jgi:hypothetical protein
MASEIVNNDEIEMIPTQEEADLLKEVTALMGKLNLVQLGKCQLALANAMLKPIKEAQKLLDKASKQPKRTSPHLRLFREWKEYVHEHAKANGWPQFTSAKKDKKSGAETVTTYDASVCVEGKYVFPTADAKGKYKTMSPVLASSLAKYYWSASANAGARQDLWETFFASFKPDAESDEKSPASPSVKKSAEEKKLEAEAKKAKAEIEKAKKLAEKELARKQKLEEKQRKLLEEAEALKRALENPMTPEQLATDLAAKKAAREAKKAAKAAKEPMKIEVVEEEKSVSVAASPAVSEKPKALKRVAAPVVAYVDNFVPHPEGDLLEWAFKGTTYFRSPLNALYDESQDFLGVFDPKSAKIIPASEVSNPDDE